MFFILLTVFALVSFYFAWYIGAAECVVILITGLMYRLQVKSRRRDIVRYTEQITSSLDAASKDSLVNFPLPMAIVRVSDMDIVWANTYFYGIAGQREQTFNRRMNDALPGFDLRWLLDGHQPSEAVVNNRGYHVYGNLVRPGKNDGREILALLYFLDITELTLLRRETLLARPVVTVIMIDNYDECVKSTTDSEKSAMQAAVDRKIYEWTKPLNGIVRKYDRDKHLLIFEERYISQLIESKFSLLEDARSIIGSSGMQVTFSIGIGKEAESLAQGFEYAQLAIDMALSRGGDQAVIKSKSSFEFYGGRSKEHEKRTKVKSRVVAFALARLIMDSSKVFIMGHKNSDIDAIGAAAGISCISRSCGKKAYVVINDKATAAGKLIEKLRNIEEYADVFINDQDAMILADNSSLLCVVDCNRPDFVEAPEFLNSVSRVAVIDHHRRASKYIDNALLNFHEPYASSACELVCELVQNACQPGDLLRAEAEAMLSGIVLDTKNFTMHTGMRTFEAAAYLRSAGADTVEIKRLMQSDLRSSLERYAIVSKAKMLRTNIAVSVMEQPCGRTTAAQAADELLNIAGVDASFVVFPNEDQVVVSGRSLGKINVQMICEKLGGGGHQTIAGAQMRGAAVNDAVTRLVSAINAYYDENNIEE